MRARVYARVLEPVRDSYITTTFSEPTFHDACSVRTPQGDFNHVGMLEGFQRQYATFSFGQPAIIKIASDSHVHPVYSREVTITPEPILGFQSKDGKWIPHCENNATTHCQKFSLNFRGPFCNSRCDFFEPKRFLASLPSSVTVQKTADAQPNIAQQTQARFVQMPLVLKEPAREHPAKGYWIQRGNSNSAGGYLIIELERAIDREVILTIEKNSQSEPSTTVFDFFDDFNSYNPRTWRLTRLLNGNIYFANGYLVTTKPTSTSGTFGAGAFCYIPFPPVMDTHSQMVLTSLYFTGSTPFAASIVFHDGSVDSIANTSSTMQTRINSNTALSSQIGGSSAGTNVSLTTGTVYPLASILNIKSSRLTSVIFTPARATATYVATFPAQPVSVALGYYATTTVAFAVYFDYVAILKNVFMPSAVSTLESAPDMVKLKLTFPSEIISDRYRVAIPTSDVPFLTTWSEGLKITQSN